MITIGTAVFHRIVEEHYAKGLDVAREAGVRALTDTLAETSRFATFSKEYRAGCAKDRFDHYLRDKNATCTNQVLPA